MATWFTGLARTCAVITALAFCFSAPVAIAGSTLVSFDADGSGGTYPVAINKDGVIAGNFDDSNQVSHGFVRATDGTITNFDPAGSQGTIVTGINNKGTIVGYYVNANNDNEGFERTADGTITTLDPNRKAVAGYAHAINTHGVIAGSWYDDSGESGFVRASDGAVQSFKGKPHMPDTATVAYGINDAGAIAGYYLPGILDYEGLIRSSAGSVSTFDVAGSSYTQACCIDNDGTVAGTYVDVDGFLFIPHSFQRASDGTITTFDPPGADSSSASAINNKGTIVGYATNGKSYLRSATGRITTFRISKSGGTFATGINDKDVVVGYYADAAGNDHGFVRTP